MACNTSSGGGGTASSASAATRAVPAAPESVAVLEPHAGAAPAAPATAAPPEDVAREAVSALRCEHPVSMRPVGPIPAGPALQWLGEIVIDGKTMETWDGATLKVHVDVPKDASPKSAEPEATIDDRGRVHFAAARAPLSLTPLACAPAATMARFDAGAPRYALSEAAGFETCDTAGRGLVVRHLASGTVTALGDGYLTFAPDDLYALLEPTDRGARAPGLPARAPLQKVTFDASGRAHVKTVANDAEAVAVGPLAYAVASTTALKVYRACDDTALGTVPLRDADAQALAFSKSGMLLLYRTATSATVFQLR